MIFLQIFLFHIFLGEGEGNVQLDIFCIKYSDSYLKITREMINEDRKRHDKR